MGALFSYSIVSSILLCCGYVVYKWLFSSEKQHSYNRVIIFFIYFISLLLPMVLSGNRFATATDDVAAGVVIGNPIAVGIFTGEMESGSKGMFFRIILGLYLVGIVAMTVYTFISVIQLFGIIKNGERIERKRYTLILTDKRDLAPFSWMRYVVMNKADYLSGGEVIVIHEQQHLKCYHWIDLLFAQIVLIFQWFNPAAWLFREEFRTVHEYQADEAVIHSGTNVKDYQMLLIKKAVGSRFHSLANSLNHSKLKKRVTMMYKEKSSLARRLGALVLVPAMALGCVVVRIPAFAGFLETESATELFPRSEGKISKKSPITSNREMIKPVAVPDSDPLSAANRTQAPLTEPAPIVEKEKSAAPSPVKENVKGGETDDKSSSEEIYSAVQQSAEPEGGMKQLLTFLHDNITYPEEAVKAGIEGRVIVRFVIEKDGSVGQAQVIKGVDSALDVEAIRVVSTMPKWSPAEVDGKPVASYFVIPVSFQLPKEEKEE